MTPDERKSVSIYRKLNRTPRWTYEVDGRRFFTYGNVPQSLPEHFTLEIEWKLDGYYDKGTNAIVCYCGTCFGTVFENWSKWRPGQ